MTKRFCQCSILLAGLLLAATASAEMPRPTTSTPTLYGAQRLAPGDFVLGMTTGYPETSFDLLWGLRENFDLGLRTGLTYGRRLGGLMQGFGLDVHVPLRWTIVQRSKWVGAFKLAPYFMIGESGPSISLGADLGFLVDIPLPKIFKFIVGPELRTGLATPGGNAGYNGALWVNFGIETNIDREFYVGLIFHGGGHWYTGRFGGGGDGLFRALIYGGLAL